VGKALAGFFRRAHDVFVYDKFVKEHAKPEDRANINSCDLVFLSVPTPMAADGSCDTSAVEDAISWIETPICIKSTVVPGTTERLVAETGRKIVCSPEYIGESATHPWTTVVSCDFLIVGGRRDVAEMVGQAHLACSPTLDCVYTDSRTAELCKYMENCYLATKVTFVNQFYDIAEAIGVDFEEVRKLWLLDSRIGSSHTTVTPERGFGGKCLPKDMSALIALMSTRGGAPVLEAVMRYNSRLAQKRSLHLAATAERSA
jgi:UDPglucose 6-dehydrogenase